MTNNINDLFVEFVDKYRQISDVPGTIDKYKESLILELQSILIRIHRQNAWHPGCLIQIDSSDEMRQIVNDFDVLWKIFNNGPIVKEMLANKDGDRIAPLIVTVGVRLSKVRPVIVTSDPSVYGFASFYAEAIKCWAYGLFRAAAVLCGSALEEVITGEISKEEKDFALSLNYTSGLPSSITSKSFQEVTREAHDRKYLTDDQYRQVEEIRLIRNKILHELEDVSEDESLEMITSTRAVIQSLLSEENQSDSHQAPQTIYQRTFTEFLNALGPFMDKLVANKGKTFNLDEAQEKQLKQLFKMNVWSPGEIVQVSPENEKLANGLMLHMMYEFGYNEDSFTDYIYEEDHEKIWIVIHAILERAMRLRPIAVSINPEQYSFSDFNKEALRAWVFGFNRAAYVLCVTVIEDVLGGELISRQGHEALQLIYERDHVVGVGRSKMRNLLGQVVQCGIINREQAKDFRKLLSKRNRILHGMEEVGSKETLKAIQKTRALIESILLDE